MYRMFMTSFSIIFTNIIVQSKHCQKILISNLRISPFVAANLSGQIRRLEEQSEMRDYNCLYLEKLLSGINEVRPAKKYQGQTIRVYYEYQLIYEKQYFNGLSKDKFREAMEAEGISEDLLHRENGQVD